MDLMSFTIEQIGTLIFAMAVLHTFTASQFQHMAHRYSEHSFMRGVFHYLGEVEAVFGLWALIFIIYYIKIKGHDAGAIPYLKSLNFTEPIFVFVIMAMAATKPIITLAEKIIFSLSKLIPLPKKAAFYVSTLIVGPMLGSLITEPAAMTLVAMILKEFYFDRGISEKFKYATIGLLFVNISVGGTLTHFAAPPVLMVASKFGWGTLYMLEHFGYKSLTAVVLSTMAYLLIFRKELKGPLHEKSIDQKVPLWIMLVHVCFLVLVVLNAHHVVIFVPLFLFFLGFVQTTKYHQSPLLLVPSLMVGFFLAGLVVLGGVQAWWLQPILQKLPDLGLFLSATGLTAITDNAALTYLGSLVDLSETAKYSLVAGAVAGGGLTVIANAPNPAGYGILKDSFKEGTISPLGLFLAALLPTIIVMICFLTLPSFNF